MYEEIIKAIEEKKLRLNRADAIDACTNLVANYQWCMSGAKTDDILDMFALKTDGVRFDMGTRVWCGPEGIKKYFKGYIDALNKALPNRMYVQNMLNFCVIAADDGKTVWGKWNTIGVETSIDENGKPICLWQWVPYWIDFIQEDGVWNIWHMRGYPEIKTPYAGEGWTEIAWYDDLPNIKKFCNVDIDDAAWLCDAHKEQYPFSNTEAKCDCHEAYPPNPKPRATYDPAWNEIDRRVD